MFSFASADVRSSVLAKSSSPSHVVTSELRPPCSILHTCRHRCDSTYKANVTRSERKGRFCCLTLQIVSVPLPRPYSQLDGSNNTWLSTIQVTRTALPHPLPPPPPSKPCHLFFFFFLGGGLVVVARGGGWSGS